MAPSPKGAIPPSDMDPRIDDTAAGPPPARHPGAAPEQSPEGQDEGPFEPLPES